jgi:hypothetical protein
VSTAFVRRACPSRAFVRRVIRAAPWAAVLSSTLALAACGPSDEPPSWQVVHDELPGGVLRVWGTSARDVYAVGSDGDGAGSLVLHYDGAKWSRLDPGTTGDLWWVEGVGPDDIRMVGEAGLILRYRPSTKTFERITAPEPITLFGVWGRSSEDVWYVGGNVAGRRGVVWRDDGSGPRVPEATLTSTTSTFFKVYGFASGETWSVGQGGTTMHFDGVAFDAPTSGTRLPLFTVHGTDPAHVWAVGGVADGVILAWDGTAWVDETPPETPQVNAVFASTAERVHAAGFNGRMWAREAGVWGELDGVPTFDDLHSVWVDDEGGIWAGGGQLASDPPRDGVLVHYGRAVATGL